jgi:ABC-type glycerol-3-phosphate transport system permease component
MRSVILAAKAAHQRRFRRQRYDVWRNALIYTLLVVVTVVMGAPFFWMVTTAVKPVSEILIYPPRWIPSRLAWENFVLAWNSAPFGRFAFNSTFVAVTQTSLELLIGLCSAYAFARVRFPGRDLLFLLVLATLMIPGDVTLIPNYVTLANLGWINTYWALIIP